MPVVIDNLGKLDAVVFESIGANEVCIHHVLVEDSRGSESLRQRRSTTAFRTRMQKHFSEHLDKVLSNKPHETPYRQFRLRWSFDWDTEQKVMAMQDIDIYPNMPVQVHSSPFEFYKAIGYDYKKKKFLPMSSDR